MKHIVHPNTPLPTPAEPPVITDVSVQRLIDDSLLALAREIKNLLIRSAKGKLDASDARDLRDHLKLLFELKDREAESLRGMSDAELKEILEKAQTS